MSPYTLIAAGFLAAFICLYFWRAFQVGGRLAAFLNFNPPAPAQQPAAPIPAPIQAPQAAAAPAAAPPAQAQPPPVGATQMTNSMILLILAIGVAAALAYLPLWQTLNLGNRVEAFIGCCAETGADTPAATVELIPGFTAQPRPVTVEPATPTSSVCLEDSGMICLNRDYDMLDAPEGPLCRRVTGFTYDRDSGWPWPILGPCPIPPS